jgi:hypothetical protein
MLAIASATLERFFDQLGPDRTVPAGGRVDGPARRLRQDHPRPRAQARVCADPFQVIKLAHHALDQVRRTAWNHRAASKQSPSKRIPSARHCSVRQHIDLLQQQ